MQDAVHQKIKISFGQVTWNSVPRPLVYFVETYPQLASKHSGNQETRDLPETMQITVLEMRCAEGCSAETTWHGSFGALGRVPDFNFKILASKDRNVIFVGLY